MRRKVEWKPKGQRRAPTQIKTEPYSPLPCYLHPKRENVACVAAGTGTNKRKALPVCDECFDAIVPPAIGAPHVGPNRPVKAPSAAYLRGLDARATMKSEDSDA